jgi:hypothetical protein
MFLLQWVRVVECHTLEPMNPCPPTPVPTEGGAGGLESLNPIKDFKNIFRTKEVSHGTED